jgi:hypothetical protein
MNISENLHVSWQDHYDAGLSAEREFFLRLSHEDLVREIEKAPGVSPYFSLWYIIGQTKDLKRFGEPLFSFMRRKDIDALSRYHAGTNLGYLMELEDNDADMKPLIITQDYPAADAFKKIATRLRKKLA